MKTRDDLRNIEDVCDGYVSDAEAYAKMKHFTLGHHNFGQLTTHVPGSNYKVYTSRTLADKDCDEIRKRNPQMKVLVCTPLGNPVRVATDKDR